MTYKEALDYMDGASVFGVNLELETTQELLTRLGNPQEGMKYIHVAGTNGKGSTVAYLAHILGCQGYKVGRYISPAVFDFCERIEITQKKNENVYTEYISKDAVAVQVAMMKEQVERMTSEGCCPPTCFELQTVLAFMEFKRQKCDFVILEVGLGGRYDSTNVIKDALCSVISSISYDHCAVLGDTIAKIAYEKAGIIKWNSTVVVYDQEVEPKQSLPVLEQEAEKKNSKFVLCNFSKIKDVEYSFNGTTFSYKKFKKIRIPLLGKNQVKNAVLVLEVVKALRKQGIAIDDSSVRDGLMMTRWMGRMDIVSKDPLVIADGAHNEDAAKALEESIQLYLLNRPLTFVIGVFKDKDYRGILRHTAKYAKRIILLTTKTERALSKEELSKVAGEYTDASIYEADSIKQALFLAKSMVEEDGAILTFGSLSFLGDIYQAVRGIGRAELILENKSFLKNQILLEQMEKERKYCKHDLSHLLDVARLTCLMSEEQNVWLSKELVYAAAFLHDLGRVMEYQAGTGHEEAGVLLAREILPQCYFNEWEIDVICDAIAEHRHRDKQETKGKDMASENEMQVRENDCILSATPENENPLAYWLKEADHRSRNCFLCEQWDNCKWSEERKNRTILW